MSGYLQYQVQNDLPAGTVISGLEPWTTVNVGRFAPTDQYGPPTPPLIQRTAGGSTAALAVPVHAGDWLTFIVEPAGAGISGLHPAVGSMAGPAPGPLAATPSGGSDKGLFAGLGLVLAALAFGRRRA